MDSSIGTSSGERPSIEEVRASPELFYETDSTQFALNDQLRLLVLHATNKLHKNTQAKGREALESHAQKRTLVDLKSRITRLTTRDESKNTGELDLRLKPALRNPFLQEENLRLACRITTLVEKHKAKDGSLNVNDPSFDSEAKAELLELVADAAAKSYTIPENLLQGTQLNAEETKTLLTHLRTVSGVDTDAAYKKLEDVLELRKQLREAEAKNLVTFKEQYTREETTDLHSLIDRQIGIIGTDIDQHNVRLQQYNQDRGNWMQVLNNVCKTLGDLLRNVARNLSGR